MKLDDDRFRRYKILKSKLNGLSYKGYPLDMVLGSYIAEFVWRGFWRPALKALFLKFNLNLKNRACSDVLSTYTSEREGYLKLISSYLGEANPVQVQVKILKKEIIKNLGQSFFYFFKALFFLLKSKVHFRNWPIFLPLFSMAFKIIDHLEKQDIKCDRYVAFNSSYLVESFLSYYFRKRSIPTFSLQHGMYFEYLCEVPLDVINYENVCANKILLWGQYSFDQINKYIPSSSEALVYGYPYNAGNKRKNDFVEYVYVLLPRQIYWEQSVELLNKLKMSNGCFIVRPHPSIKGDLSLWVESNKSSQFIIDESLLLESNLVNNCYRLVIGFNTTAVFQSLLYDQKVVIYTSGKDEFLNPGFETFNKEDSFDFVLKKLEDYDSSKYFELKKYCFKFPFENEFKLVS